MFIGHFGVAFAAKRVIPTVSLGTLFVSAQLADLVWPNLVLLGVEKVEVAPGATAVTPLDFVSYPYSHSLLALCLWAAIFATAFWVIRRQSGDVPWLLAALVLSHWVLDAVSHRPDMPLLISGGPRVGLGLWNSVSATLIVEISLFLAGVAIYASATRALDRTGRHAFSALVVFLLAVSAANLLAPPPPSARAVAWADQAMWLLIAWAYWVDAHRRPATAAGTAPSASGELRNAPRRG